MRKNIMAVIIGLVIGNLWNLALILVNSKILFPPGDGVDLQDAEQMKAYVATLPAAGFIAVLAAHVGQAGIGGYIAARLGESAPMRLAWIVGGLTLFGAIYNLIVLEAPTWMWIDVPLIAAVTYGVGALEQGRRAAEGERGVTALEFPADLTEEFIAAAQPGRPGRLLEIGCGDGRVDSRLAARGWKVLAIDTDAACVAETASRGVDARLATFPDFDDAEGFDLITFTRSLHHISEIDEACRRARELLRPGGRVVVEDWAWNRMDEATAAWAFGLMQSLAAGGLFETDEWDADEERVASWLEEHRHHGLHDDAAMEAALAAQFELESVERVPYVYRYVARSMAEHEHGQGCAHRVFQMECDLIETGVIRPLGLRLWASIASD